MAFTFQLDPEMEKALAELAKSQGVSINAYIKDLIEHQVALQTAVQKLSNEEFEAALDAMTIYSDKIPMLPLAAFKRDQIYRDHD
ncbi:MAG TPA: toxin-antitoxin system HicB family antitoxin [Candidatus Angelobacter sp.]|nr:toxin-antitoxin system HicB family antitoxin [Candidatus Angelobacter sp.]